MQHGRDQGLDIPRRARTDGSGFAPLRLEVVKPLVMVDRWRWNSDCLQRFEWEETRLEVMEALGRSDEAQAFRWACFERTLDTEHLRAYLKRLPDFDDLEVEERAMAQALAFPSVHQALAL